jgi:hypothetical protein
LSTSSALPQPTFASGELARCKLESFSYSVAFFSPNYELGIMSSSMQPESPKSDSEQSSPSLLSCGGDTDGETCLTYSKSPTLKSSSPSSQSYSP